MENGKRVLLVDDMGGIRRSVAHLLKQAGFDVYEAENGAEALRQLKNGQYELVITDILMPEVDGSEVIQWLRSAHQPCKVIAMSGGGSQSTADQALEKARTMADAILMKPFARNELMSAVNRLVA